MPITKRDVETAMPNSIIWDQGRGSVTGFGVRRQRQFPVFILKFSKAGRGRWFTIGRFGAPWTVENARAEARRLLGHIAEGRDPGQEKNDVQSVIATSVADLCDRYMDAANAGLVLTRFKRPKKPSTLLDDRGRIDRHIKPLIGKTAVSALDKRIVRQMISDISAGKTAVDEKTKNKRGRAIVKGGATAAARVADLLSGIMAWAVDDGYVSANPVHGVRRHRSEPRDRYLSNEEITMLGRFLQRSSDEPSEFHPFALTIVELLALTGCRLNEIAGLRWSEIDFQDGCLRLADSKTGRSMRPVSEAVICKLRDQGREAGSEFVFPASRGTGWYQGTKRQGALILAAAGVDRASSHTLRHTFASLASNLGYSDSTIAGLLGHAGRGVTSRYVHRPDEALKLAAESISTRVLELMAYS